MHAHKCRAYLDSINDATEEEEEGAAEEEEMSKGFGCIYLDYCGRLHAGKTNVELSPVEDLTVHGVLAWLERCVRPSTATDHSSIHRSCRFRNQRDRDAMLLCGCSSTH